MVREPAVAGQFYAAEKKQLEISLDDMIRECPEKIDAIGAVSPHAGYMYSGTVAGQVYGRLSPRDTYVILSPNHTGSGARFALSTEPWRTPLGETGIDQDFESVLLKKTALLKKDADAHSREHSIEVQLPFIQRISPQAKIVPITVKFSDLSESRELAEAIASALVETGRSAVIIASSDMTHYETRESAARKDHMAIQRMLDIDPEGLLRTVEKMDISMCGYIPAAIMLLSAKKLGAKKTELVRYTDSGGVTGDTSEVVGYAGIIVY